MQEHNDTVSLLKECNSGCKSATNSMEQLQKYVNDPALDSILDRYIDRHAAIGEECHARLNAAGMSEEDPAPLPAAMAKMSIAMKMAVDPDTSHIADMLEDGCNMGVKSLAKYRNQYKNASEDAKKLTNELIGLETEMAKELLAFL